MLIMTQSKDKIINFNDFGEIMYEQRSGKYHIYATKITNEKRYAYLGCYNTLDDVKAVLKTILLNYYKMERVFVMPKPDEINEKIKEMREML